ncbi:MAG: hypothetical protein WAW62_02230 [Candidatus Saccharimonas aalborgensis]
MNTIDQESVGTSDVFGLATWSRQRSSEELRTFVESHHDERLADIVLE